MVSLKQNCELKASVPGKQGVQAWFVVKLVNASSKPDHKWRSNAIETFNRKVLIVSGISNLLSDKLIHRFVHSPGQLEMMAAGGLSGDEEANQGVLEQYAEHKHCAQG